jgi:glycosyltransferase involved in cell wall biosynthesis
MSSSGKISIITVVKDDVDHLEKTILNVIEKKGSADIEYIVIDGASTDGSTDIIRKYDEHISYWVSESDNGIYDAMNKGWAAASYDSFILFLGAGDMIISLPNKMSSFGRLDVLFGNVRMGGKTVFKARADFHLKLYNSLHHQALMVNKTLHLLPPFNCRYRIYADLDFNQRLKKRGVKFVYSSEFIGYACPGGVSDQNCFPESIKVITANYGLLWAAVALSGYYVMKIFPVFKRLRPFQET